MTWRVFTDPGYIIGSGLRPGELRRIFIDKKSATQEYYSLQNQVIYASGDFSISAKFATATNDGNFRFIMGAHSNNRFYVGVRNGNITYGNGSVLPEVASTPISDSKLHTITQAVVGSNMVITLDRVDIVTTPLLATYPISVGQHIGIRENLEAASVFDGIIADPDLGGGNDWKLDQDPSNTEQSSGGSNLLTYVNIPTGLPTRELFTLNQAGTEWNGNNGTTLVIA